MVFSVNSQLPSSQADTKISYTAKARKEGRWWVVEIPELDSAGQAAKVSEVQQAAEEVIQLLTGQAPGSYSLTIDLVVAEQVQLIWEESKYKEKVAREEQANAAQLARQAVQKLKKSGYSQKEIAALLAVSPQRVSQLARES